MHRRRRPARRATAVAMAAVVLGPSLLLDVARAGLIRTEQVIAVGDREWRLALVQRDDVRQRMEALGVGANEAAARLGSVADAELRAVAAALDEPPTGRGIVEGVLIGAGVVFLLLIITDRFGVTDVFTFIRGFREQRNRARNDFQQDLVYCAA